SRRWRRPRDGRRGRSSGSGRFAARSCAHRGRPASRIPDKRPDHPAAAQGTRGTVAQCPPGRSGRRSTTQGRSSTYFNNPGMAGLSLGGFWLHLVTRLGALALVVVGVYAIGCAPPTAAARQSQVTDTTRAAARPDTAHPANPNPSTVTSVDSRVGANEPIE